jgi:nucleotide-binding universal stress UspA family protein
MLGAVDFGRVFFAQIRVVVVLDHQHEDARALGDLAGVLIEQLEEIAFARQQFAEKHGVSLRAQARLHEIVITV